MTQHGKIIITLGMGIFTAFGILWVLLANWQWVVVGAFIFICSAFTSLVLSVETKNTPAPQSPTLTNTWGQQSNRQDNWKQPSTPPPDQDREDEEERQIIAEDVNIDPYWGKQSDTDGTPS